MQFLREPVVVLEAIKVRTLSLSSLDLDVTVRVTNPNPIGITLRELSFAVFCSCGSTDVQLASGATGRVKIPKNGSEILRIPVASQNAALISALATFIAKGGVSVTIRGTATIDAVLFGWSVPFEKTLPVSTGQVAETLAGENNPG
jgi:LEA14-like dessication related protein